MANTALKQRLNNREELSQVQTSEAMNRDYSYQSVQRAPTQAIADLEWQVRFTQMKLNAWKDAEDTAWKRLKTLNAQARKELSRLGRFQ